MKHPSRIFFCAEQEPKPRELGACVVAVQHNGIAILMDESGEIVMRRMDRAQVDWIQADGFMVSGYEVADQRPDGKPVFRRQEWFCRYTPPKQP